MYIQLRTENGVICIYIAYTGERIDPHFKSIMLLESEVIPTKSYANFVVFIFKWKKKKKRRAFYFSAILSYIEPQATA